MNKLLLSIIVLVAFINSCGDTNPLKDLKLQKDNKFYFFSNEQKRVSLALKTSKFFSDDGLILAPKYYQKSYHLVRSAQACTTKNTTIINARVLTCCNKTLEGVKVTKVSNNCVDIDNIVLANKNYMIQLELSDQDIAWYRMSSLKDTTKE